jgi:hypothetical protein
MPTNRRTTNYTTKQMGDACEMIVAGQMTLAGVPTQKMADNWPGYDLIAQPADLPPQRISVKARTWESGGYFVYRIADNFEWLAVVLLGCAGDKSQRIFIIPRAVADERGSSEGSAARAGERCWTIRRTAEKFPEFEDNFDLTAVVSGAPQ